MRLAIMLLVAVNVFFAGLFFMKLKPDLSPRSNWHWSDRWDRSPFKD